MKSSSDSGAWSGNLSMSFSLVLHTVTVLSGKLEEVTFSIPALDWPISMLLRRLDHGRPGL